MSVMMNPRTERRWRALAGSFFLLLAGCTVEGSDDSVAALPGSGGTGTEQVRRAGFVVLGPIEALRGDTLTVEGEDWDVGAAVTTLADTAALREGLVVRLLLRGATHEVATVTAGPELVGPVQNLERDSGQFLVHNIKVFVDARTRFEGTALATLAAGDAVEVSGLPDFSADTSGGLRATLVRAADATAPARASGAVTDVTADRQELVISYGGFGFAGALFPDPDFSAARLAAGVTARLALPAYDPAATPAPAATQVLPWQALVTNLGVVLSGPVAMDPRDGILHIAGRRLELTARTRVSGIRLSDIASGTHLRVEGIVTGEGRIEAVLLTAL